MLVKLLPLNPLYTESLKNRCFLVVQEWPEEDYPPYANGPGYIISSDIAQFIVSEFEKHKLRVFDINFLPPIIPIPLCDHALTAIVFR